MTGFHMGTKLRTVGVKLRQAVVRLGIRLLNAAVNGCKQPVHIFVIAVVQTGEITVDINLGTDVGANLVALAVQIVIAFAIRDKNTKGIVDVVLKVKSGLQAPNVGIRLNRFVYRRALSLSQRPDVAQLLAVPLCRVNAAIRTIFATGGNLVADIANNAAGLFNRRFMQTFAGNNFRCKRTNDRFRRFRGIRRFIIRIQNIRQVQIPGRTFFFTFRIDRTVPHVRTAYNPRDAER